MLITALLLASLVEAPLSLTTSDGTGLHLVSLEADAVCGGPVCFTELRLAFENPEDRVIEGQFQIALPPGASVSRFAMKIDGRLQEAEVVEKQAARRAYEDFLHRRQDPALLEQAAGNQFQARVFPIPARGKKEIVIGYGHLLASSSVPYVLPLVGLPQIDHLSVRVRNAEGQALLALDKTRFVPNADAVVSVPGAKAIRAEDVVVLRASPSFATADEPGDAPFTILVDTSASRALQMQKDAALIGALVKELARASPTRGLVVLAFDQTVESMYSGSLGEFDAKALSKRHALGATDLAGALQHIAREHAARVVIVTDGVATAELGAPMLQALKQLKASGVTRIDAIVRGGVRDEVTLASIVKSGQHEGVVIDGDAKVDEVARRLKRVARSGIVVDVPGATWVWPKTLDGMQPGDERVIVAELKAGLPLSLKLAGARVDLGTASSAPAPLLRRAWAEAKILRAQEMLAATTSDGSRKEIKEQIVTVSKRHRVLSSETALLILETEADYARYGIDRKSLADILVVTDAGLSLVNRKDIVTARPPEPLASVKQRRVRPENEAVAKAKQKAMSDSLSRMEKKAEAVDTDKDGSFDDHADAPEAKAMKREESASPPPPPPPPPPPASESPRAMPELRAERRPRPEPTAAEESTGDDVDLEGGGFEQGPSERANGVGPSVAVDVPEAIVNPWTGQFDVGMKLLKAGKRDDALRVARAWREEAPGDVLALLLLASVLEDTNPDEAARALGGIIDLFPMRTDLRRAVGARLDKLKNHKVALALSIDTWKRSVEQRPDHPQSHRGLAWSLLRAGRYAEAFDAIEQAGKLRYREDGFRGVEQILRDDIGLIGAAWSAHGGPSNIAARVKKAGGTLVKQPSTRFLLWWETDDNDVDFHIRDAKGNHAFYSQPSLSSGGSLYADVTTGYGPECFTIEGKPHANPYKLSAHYYSRGPMGFGLGTLLVVEHDGKGNFTFSDRPFVIMVDGAFVDLGTVQ